MVPTFELSAEEENNAGIGIGSGGFGGPIGGLTQESQTPLFTIEEDLSRGGSATNSHSHNAGNDNNNNTASEEEVGEIREREREKGERPSDREGEEGQSLSPLSSFALRPRSNTESTTDSQTSTGTTDTTHSTGTSSTTTTNTHSSSSSSRHSSASEEILPLRDSIFQHARPGGEYTYNIILLLG